MGVTINNSRDSQDSPMMIPAGLSTASSAGLSGSEIWKLSISQNVT